MALAKWIFPGAERDRGQPAIQRACRYLGENQVKGSKITCHPHR